MLVETIFLLMLWSLLLARLTFNTSFYTKELFRPAHSETAWSCVFQVRIINNYSPQAQ